MRVRLRWALLLLLYRPMYAQTTTGGITGLVRTATGEVLTGASVTVIHEPTRTVYKCISRSGGFYLADDLPAGGPYSVLAFFTGFSGEKKTGIYVSLGEAEQVNFFLFAKTDTLKSILVKNSAGWIRGGTMNVADSTRLHGLPSSGHNVYDYIAHMPAVHLVPGTIDALSIAGQNNRYNSFYIDGAMHSDLFGLSASGLDGGQTGAFPVSVEALEQIQVSATPYDVSFGSFTGGAVNAVTRSGHNKPKAALYCSFNNRKPVAEPGYASASNYTTGAWASGPIMRNRCFYFASLEWQQDAARQSFPMRQYPGTTTEAGMHGLADIVKKFYKYDMGDFLSAKRTMQSRRFAMKMDYTLSERHHLSFSWRDNYSTAVYPPVQSTETVHFSNSAVVLPNQTSSFSAEIRSRIGRMVNRLVLTHTYVNDDRSFSGQPFPQVTVFDGDGEIVFGPDPNSTQNLLIQRNTGLFDVARISTGRHQFTMGLDIGCSADRNVFIQRSFGKYEYGSVAAFENNSAAPSSYERGISLTDGDLTDQTRSAVAFRVLKTALFFADEWKLTNRVGLYLGLRAEKWQFLSDPDADPFLKDSLLPAASRYYDLKNAPAGGKPVLRMAWSPRFVLSWHIPRLSLELRAGSGLFSGRMPLAWPAGVYAMHTGTLIDERLPGDPLRFRWNANDPASGVWRPSEGVGAVTRGSPTLVAANFAMPAVWRSSIGIAGRRKDWTLSGEALITRNLKEIDYTNINLLPPAGLSAGPGARKIYATGIWGMAARIPIATGNPYEHILLLSNNDSGHAGYGYDIAVSLEKKTAKTLLQLSWSFGHAEVWHEGTSSVNSSQWLDMEAVNGRNEKLRSISDFNAGHRVFVFLSEKMPHAFTLTVSYEGRTGAPFSYVYSGKTVTGDATPAGFYDLIYIPKHPEMDAMLFLPYEVRGRVYTPEAQKQALDTYLDTDPYLRKHRGSFAGRNGAVLPFAHRVDLQLEKSFSWKQGRENRRLEMRLGIFNLLNLVNRSWGVPAYAPFNQVSLMEFMGYTPAMEPQFRFNPAMLERAPFLPADSSIPYWSLQYSLRIILN